MPCAPYDTILAPSSRSRSFEAMCDIMSTPYAARPRSRVKAMCCLVRSASVQCDATRTTSTPRSSAGRRSRAIVAKPGMTWTPSFEEESASRAVRSATSSTHAASPSWSEDAPSPLPCPTSTTWIPAASAALQ